MTNIGIYALTFNDELVYIGQSTILNRRSKDHLTNLQKGTANYKMQEAYAKYGEPVFSVLEYCELEELNAKEVYWINDFDSIRNGLNISSGGDGGGNGVTHNQAIHSEDTIIEVLQLLADTININTYTVIKSKTGVSISSITNIVDNGAHIWLKNMYPLEYDVLTTNEELKSARRKLAQEESYTKLRGVKKDAFKFPDIQDPSGVVYYNITNAKKFAEEHNLSPQGLCRLFSSKINSHRKWTLA